MYKKNTVAVVIPAYNEEKLLGRVITTMPDYVDKMVIIDDASKDGTHDVALNFQKKQPDRTIVIRHGENTGVGGSIADGYIWCRDNNMDMAAVMAGDAQMDPDDLVNLILPIYEDRADYTKGNRLFTGDAWQVIPRVRYLGNSVLSLMTKIASGYWHISDSQCGYTVINKKALQTIDWEKMYPKYGQPNDLLVRLNIYHFRVEDVPVKPVYRIGEKSGIRPLLIIPRMFWLLVRLFFFRLKEKYFIRDFHPLLFFYFTSFILFLIDIPLIIRFFVRWSRIGVIPDITALAILFTTTTALQLSLFAMWFDMQNTNR